MAVSSYLLIAAVAMLVSPAFSLTCTSQTFKKNVKFANCTDLPSLKAFLHWNYDPATKPDPTLSIAFIAPPAKPEGWVAWALNPTATGMIGAQALIAFKDTNGSVVVKTYNISGYGPISESKIFYNVINKSAEASKDSITIFATVALPAGETELNQVWQVGAAVNNGVPAKHAFDADNLSAKNKLNVVAKEGGAEAPAPSPEAKSPATAGGEGSGSGKSGSTRVWLSGFGLYGVSVLLVVSIFSF